MNAAAWRTPMVVLVCGTLILMISLGARQTFGLLLAPVSSELGWGRETFAFAVALQSLVWGLATPVVGAIADRFGTGRVVAAGGAIYVAGLLVMAQASTPLDATLGVGLLTGIGMSATMFPVILAAVGKCAPPHRRSLYLAIASSGGSSGMFLTVPVTQFFIDGWGWAMALVAVAVITAAIVPLAAALAIGPSRAGAGHAAQSLGQAMREAGRHRGYLLLTAGYFVCGFQTMFLGAHLPAMLEDLGSSAAMGAVALTVIGLFNVIGCFAWGTAGGRFRCKYLLSWIYLLRSVVMAAFFVLPLTDAGIVVFAALIGLLWLATVPLTSTMVAQIFGLQYMATLYGFTFFSHQIGSFLGIWLGGRVFDASGSYDLVWWGAVALGLVAALLHYPIDDRPTVRVARETA